MMKKRILSLCLAIVMLLGILPVAAFAAETAEIKVSLTLTDSIAINFKVAADDMDAAAFEKLEFYNGDTLLKTVTALPTADANGMYVFSYTDIAPHMMGYTITAKLYAGNVTMEQDASVKAYCTAILKDPATYGEELAVLAMELLDYGTAAQKYLDSTVANAELVNCGAAETYPEIYALSKNELLSLNSVKAVGTEIAEPAVAWTGVGLYLQDAISIRYKFTAGSVEGLTLKVVSGASTWTVSDFYATEDGAWYAYFDGLNPNQLRSTVVATVYDSEGVAVSNSLTYSVEAYVADISQQSDDADLKTLVYQMLCYGDATANWVDTVSWSTVAELDFEGTELPVAQYQSNSFGDFGTPGHNSDQALCLDASEYAMYSKATDMPVGNYRLSGYVKLGNAAPASVKITVWAYQGTGLTNSMTKSMSDAVIGEADANGWSYFEIDYTIATKYTLNQFVLKNDSSATVYFDNLVSAKYVGEGEPAATKLPWQNLYYTDFEDGAAHSTRDGSGSVSVVDDTTRTGSAKVMKVDAKTRSLYTKTLSANMTPGYYKLSGYVKLGDNAASKVSVQIWAYSNSINGTNLYSSVLSNFLVGEADEQGWQYFEIIFDHGTTTKTIQFSFGDKSTTTDALYFDDIAYIQYLGEGKPVKSVMPADLATPAESTEPEESVPETTVPEVTEPEETEPATPVWETVADVDFESGTLDDNYVVAFNASATNGTLATDKGYNSTNSLQVDNGNRPKYYKPNASIPAGWYRISGYVYLNGADASKVSIQPWVKNASNANDTASYTMADCIIETDENGWSYFEKDVYQNFAQANYQVVFNNSSGKTVYFDNFKYEKYLGEGQPEPTPRPEWTELYSVNFEDGVTPDFTTDDMYTGTDVSLMDDTTHTGSTKALQVGTLSRAKFSKSVGTNGLPIGYYKLSGYVKLGEVDASKVSFVIWAYKNSANSSNLVKPVLSNCIVGEPVNGWSYFEVIFDHTAAYSLIQFYLANADTTNAVCFDDVVYSKYIGEDTLTLTPG